MTPTFDAHLTALRDLLGHAHVLTGSDAAPFLTDWRGRYTGRALAVVRPADTQQTAALVRWCVANQVPMVPQGGNTGLVGGGTPDESGQALVISLQRLRHIRQVDTANDAITVEAGCILAEVQAAASQAGRLFPLSLAAEGSCTIGGNLATNAGGTQVLRYGNTRDLLLGLEVVTAQGEIWDGLRGLRKDNTGYDLKHLFVGSEGTLGIITAATLKLYAQPRARLTALAAVPDLDAAVALLQQARDRAGAGLTGFEVMSGACLALVERIFPQQRVPLASAPWFCLLELSDGEDEAHAQALLESILEPVMESGQVSDAVVAGSLAQSKALWHLRESIPLAQAEDGKNIKHDISVPISSIARFVTETHGLLARHFPGIQPITFGHLGDGNLHYNVARAPGQSEAELLAQQASIYLLVHDQVHRYGGSISAEHGIGQLKRHELLRYKSGVELELMRSIKRALDPLDLMNPGKLLPA